MTMKTMKTMTINEKDVTTATRHFWYMSTSSSMGEMEDGGRRRSRRHVSALEMGNDETEYYDDTDDTEYYDDVDIRRDSSKKKNSSRIVSGEYGGISSSEDDDEDEDDDEQYAHLTTGTTSRRSQLLCTKQCGCITNSHHCCYGTIGKV